MAAVLVHIDLDGEVPHPSSLVALAAGRQVASSWGATLYAAIVAQGIDGASKLPGLDRIEHALAAAGADKVVAAILDTPVAPLWASIGHAWQRVLEHVRPRIVLFGADAPAATELGPRTGARIGARLLSRARSLGGDDAELRDRDGGYVRFGDSGAAVALIGRTERMPGMRTAVDDIDLVVLELPGPTPAGIEIVSTAPAALAQRTGVLVALGDDVATDPAVVANAQALASCLGGELIGGPGPALDRSIALAPGLCIAIGNAQLDLAGATSVVKVGGTAPRTVDGAVSGAPATGTAELAAFVQRLEGA